MKKEKTLVELNKSNGIFLTDKGSIHKYLEFYDLLFIRLRNKNINIFEVGYQYGGSCELWKLYFPYAQIRSIDIKQWEPTDDRTALKLQNTWIKPGERVRLDLIDIHKLPDDYFSDFKLDIAIDDGSHTLEDQLVFIEKVYPHMKESGYLIIEDIQDLETDVREFDKLNLKYYIVDQRKATGVKDDVFIYFQKTNKK